MQTTSTELPSNKFTQQYMAEVKAKLGIESDYALAKALQVSKTTVSNYRHGISAFSPAVCHRVAKILDVHAGIVFAAIEIDRNSGRQAEIDTWSWVHAQLRKLKPAPGAVAGAAVVATVVAAGMAPSPAEAAQVAPHSSVHYVK